MVRAHRLAGWLPRCCRGLSRLLDAGLGGALLGPRRFAHPNRLGVPGPRGRRRGSVGACSLRSRLR
eukprot:16407568-Heterocapsa_arctica.AAC.1